MLKKIRENLEFDILDSRNIAIELQTAELRNEPLRFANVADQSAKRGLSQDHMLDEEKVNIGVLGATFATTNMGVGALAAGAVRCLLNGHPQAEIHFLDYGKIPSAQTLRLKDRDISVPVINLRFSKRFYLSNNIAFLLAIAILMKAIPSRRLRHWILCRNATLRKIEQMNFFASIAGGDSFSDIYGMERLLYVSLPQILALMLGKKLVLLPQTFGPFRGKLSKMVARYILSRAYQVYSRDYRGLQELKVLMGSSQATSKFAFCYDVGFVLDPIAPEDIDVIGLPSLEKRDRPLVGVNVSGLLSMGGYTRQNMFGLRTDYQELNRELIDFLITKKDANVLLVPHVFGTGSNSESDTAACALIYEKLKDRFPGRLGLLRGQYNQNEIKYVIGKCDFFIGARMHACIAAISQAIPAVCVAYSDKFIGVLETLGNESLVVDARRLDSREILHAVDAAFQDRVSIGRNLNAKMPQIRDTVLNLFVALEGTPAKMTRQKQTDLSTEIPYDLSEKRRP